MMQHRGDKAAIRGGCGRYFGRRFWQHRGHRGRFSSAVPVRTRRRSGHHAFLAIRIYRM